jgi:hypothetical protein
MGIFFRIIGPLVEAILGSIESFRSHFHTVSLYNEVAIVSDNVVIFL